MKYNEYTSRRCFLKSAGIGAAGLTVVGSGMHSVFAASKGNLAWSDGMQVNPEIDNRIVVCCHDPQMFINEQQAGAADTFQKQNSVINTSRVEGNMDGMAIALSGKNSAQEAWATIFRKPSSKQWSEVKAAIKVNCIYTGIMPRIAIVGKVCKVLVQLGMNPANITIYDSCDGASGNGKYTPYTNGIDLPSEVVVSQERKNNNSTSPIPVGSSTLNCTNIVLNSDILINCAVNKGHSQEDKGGFTLSMKNHTGTLKFSCPNLQEMIDENKSDAILGGDPVRQQLCIVDSLWAAVRGPFDAPSHLPGRIAMGTFGPAVDISVARKIREEVMNARNHNNTAIQSILTSFSLTENELQWVDVPPFDPSPVKMNQVKKTGSEFSVIVRGGALHSTSAQFSIPSGTVSNIEILDLHGKVIRTLANTFHGTRAVWDGCSTTGAHVKSGTYIIRVSGSGFTRSQQVHVF